MKKKYYSDEFTRKAELILRESKDPLVIKMAQAYYLPNANKMTLEETARVIGFTSKTVLRYRIRFEKAMADGSAFRDRRGGRYRSLLSLEDETKFVESLHKEAESGLIPTLGVIKRKLETIVGKPVSESGVYRILKRHNWRKIKPRPCNPKADKESQEIFKKLPEIIMEQVAEKAGSRPLRVMFEDEGRFGLINGLRSCWVFSGCRPVCPQRIIRTYTHVYSAVSPIDGVMDSLVLPHADSEGMQIFIDEVSQRHFSEFIVMICDGASWHRSKSVNLPDNMAVVIQPAHSPELNPVEHIWEEMREKWFCNIDFSTLANLENRLTKAINDLENDNTKIAKLTGFQWIIEDIKIAS